MATLAERTPGARTPAARAPLGSRRIVLQGITWPTYVALTEEIRNPGVRVAFNQGVLELMSPGSPHEVLKTAVGHFIEALIVELDLPGGAMGSTTFKTAAMGRGLEPDECYYLTAAKAEALLARPKEDRDPLAPDLAVEVDWSPSAVDRPAIYAALGVAELWRFDDEGLVIDHLQADGTYAPAAASQFLPVSPDEIVRWAYHPDARQLAAWGRQLRDWIRREVAPRRNP